MARARPTSDVRHRPVDSIRAFYLSLSYSENTQVPDYWTDADDLVLFTTRL